MRNRKDSSEAWQAIGGLSYTLGELHKRGDLTDYGHAKMNAHLDKIRAALTALEDEVEKYRANPMWNVRVREDPFEIAWDEMDAEEAGLPDG